MGLPPLEELHAEMATSFGEYLLENKPLFDDFMNITEGKPGDDLTQKDESKDDDDEDIMKKANIDPTVMKGSSAK